LKINNFCITAFLTLLIYSIILFFYYNDSQASALNQAQLRTNDLLRQVKAAKMFFNNDQKSKRKKVTPASQLDEGKFLPEIYSCTYASTQINNYYNKLRLKKELPTIKISYVAKNPRNLDNQAFGEEIELLEKFDSKKLKSYSKVIETQKGKYLYFAKPVTPMKKSCLECHGNPKDAPKALIKKYGNTQGFNHHKDEIRAFVKVMMPLEKYLLEAKKLFWTIAISSFAILISIIILVRIFVTKNRKESKKFQTVIDNLDEMILVKSNTNIHSINRSFLKFFGIKNLEEFKTKYKCLSHCFISADGYLNIDLSKIDDTLIQKIKDTEKTQRVVQIANQKGDIHSLTIKIDKLEDNENLHVIVLSDITTLQKRLIKFEKRANIDTLTGAYSRAKFDYLYNAEFSRSKRYLNPLTIIFIDIDHFKKINDTYGHDVGDEVLKKFANLISSNSREFDVFARWGGEEFILMLPQTNINDGYKLAQKIRNIIASHKFDKIGTLTCSIGLSMLNKGDTKSSLIKRADNALYKAKSAGRNRTIIEI